MILYFYGKCNTKICAIINLSNCCLKRRALHPNALPTRSVPAAGQLGNRVNPKVKLLFGGPKAPLSKGSCRRSRLRGLRQAPKICTSRCQEIPAPCRRFYGFAEPFWVSNCLLRIPPLPLPCKQGRAWRQHSPHHTGECCR